MHRHPITAAVATAALLLSGWQAAAQTVDIAPDQSVLSAPFSAQDESAFLQPPKVFWPETWFHFIGGNVSEAGIDADLKAISEAGLAGIQWFHGHFGGQWPGTKEQVRALTPRWEELVGYLGNKADSLGLRLTVQTCPGWAMAGGPWIQPEDAMRMLVWSRTDVETVGQLSIKLPVGQPSDEEWRDYRDICVLAFPTPEGDTGTPIVPQEIRSDNPAWKALLEGTAGESLVLEEGASSTVSFKVPDGCVIRTLSLPNVQGMTGRWTYDPGIHVTLKALAKDGSETVLADADVPMTNWQDYDAEMDLACNEVKDADGYTFTISAKHPLTLRYLRFLSAARKNNWRGEAGWNLVAKEPFQEHTLQSEAAFVDPLQIHDLSGMMDASGTLKVANPGGRWTVLRIGHVNSGQRNGPAPPEATGWECNKFDVKGARMQFSNYVGMLQDGPLGGSADGMLMDSWECRTQTWTATMESDFARERGYSLREWMPALLGYVIGSQEKTSRFLIDWRRTVNSLYCNNFFKEMTDLAHEKGMKVQYETAGGDVVTMDPMEYYKYADIPMCEFWQPLTVQMLGNLDFKPIKPTVSAAHIYGKPRVAAESFTSFALTWDEHWQMLREVANVNMSEGVTHNVFHTYTHNPQVGFLPPGTSFGSGIGTPFLRGQTWWKYMPWFTSFLSRTSYMLERGKPVVDVLWYLGDEVGHRPFQYTGNGTRQSGTVRFPEGYKYDYCNTDALLGRLSVKDGKICTPEGIEYSVLWIPENERMLPATIEKIGQLIREGAKVVAQAPLSPATLGKDSEGFDNAVEEVWGKARNGRITRLGKGSLAVGMSLDKALKSFGIKPHLKCDNPDLLWSERAAEGAHWYFIAAPVGEEGFHGTVTLRGKGKAQWWNPVDGSVRSLKTRGWGRYKKVRLDLEQAEGGFVVFRKDKDAGSRREKAFAGTGKHQVEVGGWTVRFPEGWGAPTQAVAIDSLKAWKDLGLGDEASAFSGTATYETTLSLPASLVGKDLVLDLGKVDFIADVKVNGSPVGVLWTAPYRLPVKGLLHEGENTLTIEVTGTWYNRLAYDAAQEESQRKTWTINGPAPGSPLRESGLMGPVVLRY